MNKIIIKVLLIINFSILGGCLTDQMAPSEITPWIIEESQRPSENIVSGDIEDAKTLYPLFDDRGVGFMDSLKKYCSTNNLDSISYGPANNNLFIGVDLLQECQLPIFSNRNVFIKVNNISPDWLKLAKAKVNMADYTEYRYLHFDDINRYVYYLKLDNDRLSITIRDMSCNESEEISTDFSEKLDSIEVAVEEINTKNIFKSQKFVVEKNRISKSGNRWNINPTNERDGIFLKIPIESLCVDK